MLITLAVLALAAHAAAPGQRPRNAPGTLLEAVPWPEAERLLRPDSVVVIPLGAASKEHGPHLPLRNDLTLAEYLARRVQYASAVVIAPPPDLS